MDADNLELWSCIQKSIKNFQIAVSIIKTLDTYITNISQYDDLHLQTVNDLANGHYKKLHDKLWRHPTI